MSTKVEVELAEEFVIEGQSLAADDFIKVKSAPGRKDGFTGVFRGVWMDDDGKVTAIDVWGGKAGKEKMRTFRLERIEFLSTRAQNKMRKQRQLKLEGE